ncbi:hypothetical protein M422DRAFT_270226, partial [Sphaerobolus stellatus SS14]
DDDEEADVDIRNWEPPHWKFDLFAIGNRNNQWVMDSRAQHWLATRMHRFNSIRGPEGVTMRVYHKRMKYKTKKRKEALIEELYGHWKTPHTFKYLLGKNPGKEELKQAHRRVHAKVNALIAGRGKVSRCGPDVFRMLFERMRRPSAKELWAHEEEATAGPLSLQK